MKTRGQIAREECNSDPIFLLQVRRTQGISEEYHGEIEWDSDAESYRYKGRKVSEDYLAKNDMLLTYWATEYVFMYREEAEAEAKRREYYYGKQWVNWRAYCVCARGALVNVLELKDIETTAPTQAV